MDISVNLKGTESLSASQERRIKQVVQSAVTKEIRKEQDSKAPRNTLTVIKETPNLLTMFLSTTYGVAVFLMAVAIIAIPASALGGALYVSSNSEVTTYKIKQQEVPAASEVGEETVVINPHSVQPASSR